ncbi:MAG: DUF1987 domain-containing protein [Crocinitomicaceae bacterium]|nr:DUF1987 domain-containing protein [Crocinitomicaceae bacterium]
MEDFNLEKTLKTPTVKLNAAEGVIELTGRSIPEDAIAFYQPILSWIEGYKNNPAEKTKLIIKLEYFNTASSKCLLDVFKASEGIRETGKEVVVYWHFEEDDDDMEEAGEDYQAIVNLPFKLIEVDEIL